MTPPNNARRVRGDEARRVLEAGGVVEQFGMPDQGAWWLEGKTLMLNGDLSGLSLQDFNDADSCEYIVTREPSPATPPDTVQVDRAEWEMLRATREWRDAMLHMDQCRAVSYVVNGAAPLVPLAEAESRFNEALSKLRELERAREGKAGK